MKTFLRKHGKMLLVSMMSAIAMCFSIVASAADESSAQTAFSTALTTVQSDIMTYIGLALPVGLAIFGAIIAIKKGIGFVKSLLGKAS